ncbi:MAG: methylenetetrahydrofolate--tRNA-(uracil(54)-C(5))-methyltransferase (FADH(2)-oxidizing) TrmFO [Bdellovibrionales bacterium]|nr:methylenetetrahydrofolate--tRNA-(uracil(54)-C(5))-methyltransferase (FADH(2)-oxidizing) TrmFO [Bdellovibrionales bacterium]
MAGVEAAMMIAKHGFNVRLFEMKPKKFSPAHKSPNFAEIVCSNSFGSLDEYTAPALLKDEMNQFGSVILSQAMEARVPAGRALGVDREKFSALVTSVIANHPHIEIVREECATIPDDGYVVIATGPMTSDALSSQVAKLIGNETLYFYDSISPIVDAATIDMDQVFYGSRYEMDQKDYLNCPMTKEQYDIFVSEIKNAQKVEVRDFEELKCFEGCQPIENLVDRGLQTLAFGPMKPVGLTDPKTGKTPYAVVQLRRENMPTTMYNLVGFQTRMKWGEQKRIFSTIPGLERVEFIRMGSMHRNTYIHSPSTLKEDLALKTQDRIFFAGQLTGVEGYVESAAMGQWVGLCIVQRLLGLDLRVPPPDTAFGALIRVITSNPLQSDFSPMNINFGILPPLENTPRMKKKDRRKKMVERAQSSFKAWWHERKEAIQNTKQTS